MSFAPVESELDLTYHSRYKVIMEFDIFKRMVLYRMYARIQGYLMHMRGSFLMFSMEANHTLFERKLYLCSYMCGST